MTATASSASHITDGPRALVPLQRKFSPIPDAYQRDDLALDEMWPGHFQQPSVEWAALEQAWRVVILAEAGAGKTYELRSTAARLLREGKRSFFIRLEDLTDDFDTAFEIGSPESFGEWANGTDEAWFFLDSVDEMRLTNTRAFEEALDLFAQRISDSRQRAHVYLSSRPYAWRGGIDRALVERLLPFAATEQRQRLGDDPGSVNTEPGAANVGFQLFLLGQLSDTDVDFYARFRGLADVEAFNTEVVRSGLEELVRRPFDLEELLAVWQQTHALPNRLEVLQTTTRRQIEAVSTHATVALDADTAERAARLLAACAVLAGEPNIRLPGHPHDDGIDPSLLFPTWSPEQIRQLLGAGIFGDPIYGTVRFRHREIRELLAAEWFVSQCRIRSNRADVQRLLFRSRYGVDIIPLRLRSIFPWLVLLDGEIRARAFDISPEVAVEGGDVGRLARTVRVDLLERLLLQLATPGSPFRGLDYHQVNRIADSDLAPDVVRLIGIHAADDDAIFLLARIVTQGRMRGSVARLAPIAIDPLRGIWTRLTAAAAVLATGTREEAGSLLDTLNAATAAIPRRLFAEILEHAPADEQSVAQVLDGLDMLEPRNEHEIDNVIRGLHLLIDRLPVEPDGAAAQPMLTLLKGLRGFLDRAPWVERRDCQVSQEFQWLMPAAIHCIERLIAHRSMASFDDAVMALLVSAPVLTLHRSSDFDERSSTLKLIIPDWPELNDALFWWTVAWRRGRTDAPSPHLGEDWPATWAGHFWQFDAASFARTLEWIGDRTGADDKAVALARSVRTFDDSGRPEGWRAQLEASVADDPILTERLQRRLDPAPTAEMAEYLRYEAQRLKKQRAEERRATRDRQDFVKRLVADPESLRNPAGLPVNGVSRGQWALLQSLEPDGVRSSRSHPVRWRALVPEFGEAVAQAFRDAATTKWRTYVPGLRSEGTDTGEIPGGLLFAMAGLEIDAGEDGRGLVGLPEADIRMALRFAPHELNGFPRWIEPLLETHPRLVHDFLWTEIAWELRTSPSETPHHYVLHDIVYYAPWFHAAVAPTLVAWLTAQHAPNTTCLRYVRQILVSGGATPQTLATLARAKVADPTTPLAHLPTYLAMLVDADPAAGVPQIKAKLGALPTAQAKPFAEEFLIALVGSRREATSSTGVYRRQPTYLKQLYILSFHYVKAAEDIDRTSGGVYSPDRRDHAQEARSILLSMLTDISGELTYRAILELAEAHPEPTYRRWMLIKAREHAISDGDLSTRVTADVAQLANRLDGRAALEGARNAQA